MVPRSVVAGLGTRRVRARIGEEAFEVTLGAYGGRTYLGLRTSLLVGLGVSTGDTLHVELEPGTPVVEPEPAAPPSSCVELHGALAQDDDLRRAWDDLPETHRTEYGRWISGADGPGARAVRVARLRNRLLPG